jgi:hypothetical protein
VTKLGKISEENLLSKEKLNGDIKSPTKITEEITESPATKEVQENHDAKEETDADKILEIANNLTPKQNGIPPKLKTDDENVVEIEDSQTNKIETADSNEAPDLTKNGPSAVAVVT